MKKSLKKIIISIFICCSIYGIFNLATNYFNVKADSGWDSSYDSGSSSSGSSWSESSSSHSSGSSWSGSSSSSSSSGEQFWVLVFIFSVLILIYVFKYAYEINGEIGFENHNYDEISDDIITEVDPNLVPEEFMLNAFQIYKDIQTAWMNFDTKTIRNLTTDELYNMYSSQLEALQLKNQRNMMEDITLEDVRIVNIEKENNIITINVYLWVKCYDYVINEATKETLRGNDSQKINIEYEISFVKKVSKTTKKTKCTNCGAKIEMNASANCPYCRSTLVKISDKYVMSKKTCIGQSLDE